MKATVCCGGPLSGMSAMIVDGDDFQMTLVGGEYVLRWNEYLKRDIWRWVSEGSASCAGAEGDPVARRVAARAQLTRGRVRMGRGYAR